MTNKVTSRRNKYVLLARRLRFKRHRDKEQLFLIEGTRELQNAIAAQVAFEFLFFARELISSEETRELLQRLVELCEGHAIELDVAVLESISYGKSSSGLLAVARSWDSDLNGFNVASRPLYLVASGIEKPGNLGAMFRSADAVAADGVIVVDLVSDLLNPNVIRSSLGTVFSLPSARTTREAAADWLQSHGVSICAASPESELAYHEFDFSQSVAIVIGSEAGGLDEYWLNAAATTVSLPQLGRTDSLNAAHCASVLLFEAYRQRATKALC